MSRRMNKLLVFFLGFLAPSLALECYSCVYNKNDPTCLLNPTAVQPGPPTVNCVQGDDCCNIIRGDYLEDLGTPWTFMRGCQPNCSKTVEFGTTHLDDATSRFYSTYCNTPFCNVGDGTKDLADGGGIGDSSDSIYVPAVKDSGASIENPKMLLTVLLPLLVLVLRNNNN